ncbi:MAG TPA: HypC/HybG/HupF family hydrogenase formation chaperone [Terriglobales bacterium]|jgi:hydrogenase expression/formation protein HypC|nr:HypC/HybG/HupF family hydrogenase formation chaperone [Terriglobales bacterium]
MCLAIPGRILEIGMAEGVRVGRVEFGGIVRQVCLDFVPQAKVGDFVMVHVGFAISCVDRQEAERTYEALKATGILEQELSPEGS